MVKLSPIVSEFDSTEEAEAYEVWFRQRVQEGLDDTSPSVPHDEVMRQIQDIIDAAKLKKLGG